MGRKPKLTIEQEEEIRQRYKPERVTLRQLAREYGVTHPVILRIVNEGKKEDARAEAEA